MSDEIVLDWTNDVGVVVQERVPIGTTRLKFVASRLVGVSDNIVQLTRVDTLRLWGNVFDQIPAGVLAMTQLTYLNLCNNVLTSIPREIGRLNALTHLLLAHNKLAALPREISQLHALEWLFLDDNALVSPPVELGGLRSLQVLYLRRNQIAWLPIGFERLPANCFVSLNGNPLPIDVGPPEDGNDSRAKLPELFAATTALSMIREEATTIAIGLQDLELPALLTLEIVDAAFPNSIPMHKKWDLVVAVKHFHQRH